MPRKATGTVQWVPPKKGVTHGHFNVRVTMPDGTRPWFDVPPRPRSKYTEQRTREKALEWTERARRGGIVSVRKEAEARLATATSANAETCADWFDRHLKAREARGISTAKDSDDEEAEAAGPASRGRRPRTRGAT